MGFERVTLRVLDPLVLGVAAGDIPAVALVQLVVPHGANVRNPAWRPFGVAALDPKCPRPRRL